MKINIFCLIGITIIIILQNQLYPAVDIPADDSKIQYFGRWDFTDPLAPSHSWPGVYIVARFEGTSIGVKLNDNYCYYNVFIDGELRTVFHPDKSGITAYSLVSGLSDSIHTILFTKRNETWTKFSFHGFVLDDSKSLLPPPSPPERKIEFIGDSYTSASGNEYDKPDKPAQDNNITNIYKGFGPIIARYYDAQYQMTSRSGYGMVMDWQGNTNGNLPDIFDQTHHYTTNPAWDFEQFVPHLVVVGLGLNDYSGFGGWSGPVSESNRNLYKSQYHAFIQTIRDEYAGVKILAVAPHVEWLQTVISEIVREENDAQHEDVYYAFYPYYPDGYVYEGHPNVETHEKIANELIEAIDSIDAFSSIPDSIAPFFINAPASPFVVWDTLYTLKISTDSYANVRYSSVDKSYTDMENKFTFTGKRDHSVQLHVKQDEQHTLYLRAEDLRGNAMDSSLVVSFRVDTLQKPVNWRQLRYPGRNWPKVKTPAGYGINDITPIEYTNTTYFRRSFELGNPSLINYFRIYINYDDAVSIYLNGSELKRINLPESDSLMYATEALTSSQATTAIDLNATTVKLLKSGLNVFAIEVHQFDDVQDSYFDASLIVRSGAVLDTLIPYGEEWSCYNLGNSPPVLTEGDLSPIEPGLLKIPERISLEQNYPNPFNSQTLISYHLSTAGEVRLSVFNILGQEVSKLIEGNRQAGRYSVTWDAAAFPSGIFFYRLSVPGQTRTGKMLHVK